MATDRPRPRKRAVRSTMFALGALALGAAQAVALSPLPAGPRETAAVLFRFDAAQAEPFSPAQVSAAIFTAGNSVNAFEKEQSFSTIELTGKNGAVAGDVFGWHTITASTATCDPDIWMGLANDQVQAAGGNLSGYRHVVYLFPRVSACGWSGLADVSGPVSFINGTLSSRVIAHELGHNLGALHASSLRCVDGVSVGVTYSATCTPTEYGDPFDVMGSGGRHSSAVTKARYGFIPPANEVTATASGTYVLSSSSVPGAGVQSLRVRRGTSNEYWHFEHRTSAGVFDNFLASDPAVNGLIIRLSRATTSSDWWHTQTFLVDANPVTTSLADAPLPVGASFSDPSVSGSPTVTLESIGAGTASVRVHYPGPGTGEGSTPLAAAPAATTPPLTPPGGRPSATVVVRRINRTTGQVRVTLPATMKTPCVARVARSSWRRCGAGTSTVTITRGFPVRLNTVPVSVRLSGTLVLNRRFRVPAVGAKRRTTVVPIRAPHDHSSHPH